MSSVSFPARVFSLESCLEVEYLVNHRVSVGPDGLILLQMISHDSGLRLYKLDGSCFREMWSSPYPVAGDWHAVSAESVFCQRHTGADTMEISIADPKLYNSFHSEGKLISWLPPDCLVYAEFSGELYDKKENGYFLYVNDRQRQQTVTLAPQNGTKKLWSADDLSVCCNGASIIAVVSHTDSTLDVFNQITGDPICHQDLLHNVPLDTSGVCMLGDDLLCIASFYHDNLLNIHSATTGERVRTLTTHHLGLVTEHFMDAVCARPDGDGLIVVATEDIDRTPLSHHINRALLLFKINSELLTANPSDASMNEEI